MVIKFETREEFNAFKEIGNTIGIPIDVAFKCTAEDPTIRINPSAIASYEAMALQQVSSSKMAASVIHDRIMDVLRMVPKGTFKK